MKISPINNINTNKKLGAVKQTSSNIFVQNQKPQITELTNIYYPVFKQGRTRVQEKTITTTQKEETPRKHSSQYPTLYEHPTKFKLAKYDGLPCPSCGNTMLTKQKFKTFQKRLDETEPNKYLYLLGEYTDYMRPIEKSVYNELVSRSSDLQTNDIREILVSLRDERLSHLQRIQTRKLQQMKKYCKNLPSEERKALNVKFTELGKQIKSKDEESPFRRKRMIYEIKEMQVSDPIVHEKLIAAAESFPASSDINSAWIVKYSGKNKYNQNWTSKEIAERMLANSVSNTDHMLAYSLERNHDDITNYVAMHCGCNSTKGNKPFMQWFNEAPEARRNYLNAYFKKAYELISTGVLNDPKYKHYVAFATNTILDLSKGQVEIESDDKTPLEVLEEEKRRPLPTYPQRIKVKQKDTEAPKP